jgi:flagellar protein FliO/FliZ
MTQGEQEPEIPRVEPPDLGQEGASLAGALIRLLVVLGLVVGLAYLTLNVGLRRFLGIGPHGQKGFVQVVERVPLDQKRVLYVVRAGDEVLLIGASDVSVSLVSKLDPRVLDQLPETGATAMSPFLQKLLRKNDASPPKA